MTARGAYARPLSRLLRHARLVTGLVLVVFVTGHLLNHAAGIISVDAMESIGQVLAKPWQWLPATVLLYASLALHAGLGLRALARRRTLRMPPVEAAQLVFGLVLPLLLIPHFVGARWRPELMGYDAGYDFVVDALSGSWFGMTRQSLMLALVAGHAVLGVHLWLRHRRGYQRGLRWLYPVALLLPTLAFAGFYAGAAEMLARVDAGEARPLLVALESAERPEAVQAAERLESVLFHGWIGVVLGVFGLRAARGLAAQRARIPLQFAGGTLSARPGATLLESLREARIAHASVCGGRARCTTCRVRVSASEALPPPNEREQVALTRIGAAPDVRLACQLRPLTSLRFEPLVAVDAALADGRRQRLSGGVSGAERKVVAMFVDMRGSTRLGEVKLPYDVVFILNLFFAEMAAALKETRGHYAQFSGDGLMALYALEEPLDAGCRSALRGAVAMSARLDALNERLASELETPLRIGIGLHCGDAIVGTMGPPTSPNYSGIGDTINIAARLEALCKDRQCTIIASRDVIESAGVDVEALRNAGATDFEADVRGRAGTLPAFAIGRAEILIEAQGSLSSQVLPIFGTTT